MVRTPLARRIGRDAALNDVHLFVPYFDAAAVKAVVEDLRNVEDVPPSETGSARELVILTRRPGLEAVFAALGQLVTYRVNAARAQSHLRRYHGLARGLTLDRIDANAWDQAKSAIVGWMGGGLTALKAIGAFAKAETPITRVEIATMEVQHGTGLSAPGMEYEIEATAVDIARQFEAAGRVLGNGLHDLYWRTHGDREALEVKVEVIVLAGDTGAMRRLEAEAEAAFDQLYDRFKAQIGALPEGRRQRYERLRLATAKPVEVPWVLPDSIDFRRTVTAPRYERHLYLEPDGQFRADLGSWEAGVLKEELANPVVLGWLRNQDRKPWSLEIPYPVGGEVRPMFPDLIVVRQVPGEEGYRFDILEPHDSSLDDNVAKAVGLARFAEQHGHLFGRIQLIRRQSSPTGGEAFFRLEINSTAVQKKLLLMTTHPQLDALFDDAAACFGN
jgi:type III restriction enzyme